MLSGVRGRVTVTVLVVSACLYSLLATIGFVQIAQSGRRTIEDRVNEVLDQLERELGAGGSTVSVATADGVRAELLSPGATAPSPADGVVLVVRPTTLRGAEVVLVGRASEAPLTDSLRSLYRVLWIGVPIAVALTAVAAALATRRALRPIAEMTAFANDIGGAESSARIPVPDTDDEIAHLAATLNRMLDRIADGRRAQRRFTSDAAHELRTPLMALQGELELVRSGVSEPEAGVIERLDGLADRLSRRVDDLVLLSTLDEVPPLRRTPVDLADVVRGEVEAWAPGAMVSADHLVVMVDEPLVRRAVANLLANARRHCRAQIAVIVEAVDARVWVHVDDDGPGIPAADRPTVFDRFRRLDDARSSDVGGSGLGLAIVASVASAHSGGVAAAEAPLGGARLSVWLPR